MNTKTFALLGPLLKRVLHTNKFTSLGGTMALVGVLLLLTHHLNATDFLALIGLAVTVIGYAGKDGVRADVPVAPENITPGADVPATGPGAGPVVGLLLLLLSLGLGAGCASQLNRPPVLNAVTSSLVATSRPWPGLPAASSQQALAAAPDSVGLPPYLVAPPKGLTKRQERQFRRAQRRALVEAARVVPGKLKVQNGSAYNAAPDGTAVALHKSDAPVGIGPGTTTDNRNVGRGANGGVTSAAHDAGPASGATTAPVPGLLARAWAGVKEWGLVVLGLAFFAGLLWLRLGPIGSGVRAAALAARLGRKNLTA